jgi:hypothetical protein
MDFDRKDVVFLELPEKPAFGKFRILSWTKLLKPVSGIPISSYGRCHNDRQREL